MQLVWVIAWVNNELRFFCDLRLCGTRKLNLILMFILSVSEAFEEISILQRE